jgi:hypothetical protein
MPLRRLSALRSQGGCASGPADETRMCQDTIYALYGNETVQVFRISFLLSISYLYSTLSFCGLCVCSGPSFCVADFSFWRLVRLTILQRSVHLRSWIHARTSFPVSPLGVGLSCYPTAPTKRRMQQFARPLLQVLLLHSASRGARQSFPARCVDR